MSFFNIFRPFNSKARKGRASNARNKTSSASQAYSNSDYYTGGDYDVEQPQYVTGTPRQTTQPHKSYEAHLGVRDPWLSQVEPEIMGSLSSRSPVPSVRRYSAATDAPRFSSSSSASKDGEDFRRTMTYRYRDSLDFHRHDMENGWFTQTAIDGSSQGPVVQPLHTIETLHNNEAVYGHQYAEHSRVPGKQIHVWESPYDTDDHSPSQNVTITHARSRSLHKFGRPSKQNESDINAPVIYEHEIWNGDDVEPELYYYIVPAGLNVVFRDNRGNEVTRVGQFGNSVKKPRRVCPTIVQDEYGNELYRTGDFGSVYDAQDHDNNGSLSNRSSHSAKYPGSSHPRSPPKAESTISYTSVPSDAMNIILIDEKGYQIPIRSARSPGSPQQPSASKTSYR